MDYALSFGREMGLLWGQRINGGGSLHAVLQQSGEPDGSKPHATAAKQLTARQQQMIQRLFVIRHFSRLLAQRGEFATCIAGVPVDPFVESAGKRGQTP